LNPQSQLDSKRRSRAYPLASYRGVPRAWQRWSPSPKTPLSRKRWAKKAPLPRGSSPLVQCGGDYGPVHLVEPSIRYPEGKFCALATPNGSRIPGITVGGEQDACPENCMRASATYPCLCPRGRETTSFRKSHDHPGCHTKAERRHSPTGRSSRDRSG